MFLSMRRLVEVIYIQALNKTKDLPTKAKDFCCALFSSEGEFTIISWALYIYLQEVATTVIVNLCMLEDKTMLI